MPILAMVRGYAFFSLIYYGKTKLLRILKGELQKDNLQNIIFFGNIPEPVLKDVIQLTSSV